MTWPRSTFFKSSGSESNWLNTSLGMPSNASLVGAKSVKGLLNGRKSSLVLVSLAFSIRPAKRQRNIFEEKMKNLLNTGAFC